MYRIRRRIRRDLMAAIAILAIAGVASGCTSGSGSSSTSSASSPSSQAPSSSAPPTAASTSAQTVNVTISNAVLKINDNNGSLSGTIVNGSTTTYHLGAISCACAKTVTAGKPDSNGGVTPIAGGAEVPANGRLDFGSNSVAVVLTGLFSTVKSGSKIPITVYLGSGVTATGTATVK